jgi:hypothetical protein
MPDLPSDLSRRASPRQPKWRTPPERMPGPKDAKGGSREIGNERGRQPRRPSTGMSTSCILWDEAVYCAGLRRANDQTSWGS